MDARQGKKEVVLIQIQNSISRQNNFNAFGGREIILAPLFVGIISEIKSQKIAKEIK